MEKTKILIVDDHPENIVALSELILSDDLHIMTAQKPDEALAHLLDHDFALCLLDVQMPDMSGFELAQLIRGVHKTRHLPVIFVTAHQHDKNIIFQGYESGAVDFLFKPLDPHIVRSKVRTFVELDKQNKLLKNKMEEVEFLRKKAEQANLSKSQFLANMSHEIRTPLASVLGFSDVLTQESLPEEEKADSLSAIRRNGELLLRLIDDILDLSKIEAHQLHFLKSDFSLVELLNDVESTLDLKAEDKGIDLKFDFPKDISITYYSDAIRIKQILLNVIGNALKFTEKGSVTVRLSIHKNSHGISKDTLVFEVQDTGVGIAENDIGNLFQPFSQADLSSRKKFGGTGLGLVISRELARSLDGDLKLISSKPGVGSFFEITLGLERSANTLAPSQSEVKHQAPEALKTSLANSKILVVDDVSDNRLLIERYMQGTGAQILQASNGIDAISLTEQENPDLVLMDIQMPIMDGYETVRRIRTGGYIRPIIALTAHAMKEEAQKCLDAGCDDVLTKPARRKELIARISETLEHDREQHPH